MDFWTKWMKLLKVCSNFLPIQWDFHWRKTICSTENHYKCLYSLCLTDQSHSSELSKTDEEATSREDRDKEYEEWKQKIIESATKALSAGKKTVEKQKSWVVIVLSAGRKTSPCPWLPKVDPSEMRFSLAQDNLFNWKPLQMFILFMFNRPVSFIRTFEDRWRGNKQRRQRQRIWGVETKNYWICN